MEMLEDRIMHGIMPNRALQHRRHRVIYVE